MYDVVIIGAGPAGLGVAAALAHLGVSNVVVLERGRIGESFRHFPPHMRLLTPSFPTNGFGSPDLNAFTHDTSPGFGLREEHPSGESYATYLETVAEMLELRVETGVVVQRISTKDDGWVVETSTGARCARFVVLALGERAFPRRPLFEGNEHALHAGDVRDVRMLEGAPQIIIGGYESGIDLAIALARLGRRSVVIDRHGAWAERFSDPSRTFSPRTFERLRAVNPERLELVRDEATRIVREGGTYAVETRGGARFASSGAPVLATGYRTRYDLVEGGIPLDVSGFPTLTENDEVVGRSGLFVAGPMLRHRNVVFCFIYKFRQRFAIVARAIGRGLGRDVAELETFYRKRGMFLDDLSCCDEECVC